MHDFYRLRAMSGAGLVGMPTKLYSLQQVGEASASKWEGQEGLSTESTRRKARAESRFEASQSTGKPQKSRPAISRERHFDGHDLTPHRSYSCLDAFPLGVISPHANNPFAMTPPASIRKCPETTRWMTPDELAMTGPAGLLSQALDLYCPPDARANCFGQAVVMKSVPHLGFVLPAGIRGEGRWRPASAAAPELEAFASLAAVHMSAMRCREYFDPTAMGDPWDEDEWDGEGEDESVAVAGACTFRVADVKFSVEFTRNAGGPDPPPLPRTRSQCHAMHCHN